MACSGDPGFLAPVCQQTAPGSEGLRSWQVPSSDSLLHWRMSPGQVKAWTHLSKVGMAL